jgi:hypothetical protein
MKRFAFAICVLILTFAGNAHAKGNPNVPGCGDVPIAVSFVTFPGSAINNDIGQVYQGGVDGLDNTVIHYNRDCFGSHDATMLMPSPGKKVVVKRKVSFQFPSPVPGSIIAGGPPAFAGGSAFLTPVWMNIRNLTGFGLIPQGAATVYYTRMIFQFDAPDGGNYRLVFDPDSAAECPAGETCNLNFGGPDPASKNQPVQTAWVKVTHTPAPNPTAPWSTSNADKWVVDGNLTSSTNPSDPTVERGALLRDGIHYGQYSLPFQIQITALAKLPQE